MNRRASLLLLLVAACRLPGAAPEATKPKGPAPPAWVGRTTFTEGGTSYGVGQAKVEAQGCWEPGLLIGAAVNRARAALGPELAQGPEEERRLRLTKLERSEPLVGWFDGDRTVYTLVGISTSTAGRTGPPPEGVPPLQLADRLRAHNLAELNREGACSNPHRRADLPCCGPLKTFCTDPTRYDVKGSNGVCGCGSAAPCLYDFLCQDRGGKKQCRCAGNKCPCGILKCDPGETCQDGRCF